MPEKRATIAQISDLHINHKVEPSVTDMLKRLLQKIRPDVLVVSGDLANQPLPWQMKKAAQLVREIEDACKPTRVIVIPGNHDFKFWGNVGLRRLSRIPFEIYFRRNGLGRGILGRGVDAVKLAFNALWWKGRAMREPVIADLFPERPELGVAIFAINSNTLAEMMAAGKVESRDFQDLYAKFDEAEKSPKFAFYYKVAVVHHHPAPIADAPTYVLARLQDSFMIFYNAGLFVRELSRRGFNLVLHGHKHVAGFLRITCEFEGLGRTTLPIAAAGTACHPAPDDSRGHHLHVIEIFDDDTARLHSRFFSADVEEKDESRSYELDTIDDVRRRRNAIAANLQKYFVNEVRKTVQITTDGYTFVQIENRGSRVVAKEGLETIPLTLTTARPSYLRGLKTAPGSSAFVNLKPQEQTLYKFVGKYELGLNQKPGGGPFQFGYCYRLMNGHVLTAEEFVRHYSDTKLDSEYASIAHDGACDLMTLDVQFPPNYDVDSLEFRAIAEYVAAPLQGIPDSRLDSGDTKQHDGETERIRGNLRRGSNGWVLTCPDPIPGMIYKLCWRFRKLADGPKQELTLTAEIAAARRKFLSMATRASTDHAARANWVRARSILDMLARDLNVTVSGPQEDFHISVMVFDDDSQRLKFICSNTEPEAIPTGDFFAGEGCAGFAFEKARCILYHPARDPIGYYIHQHEWPTTGRMHEPEVLASFPWIHTSVSDQSMLVVGVVNISSSKLKTKLLGLFDIPESQRAGMMNKLQALVNWAAQRLLYDI